MEIKIPARYLAALKLFAGDRDIRYYLNGVCVEADIAGATLVATDGHRLAAIRANQDLPRAVTVVIKNEMLKGIKKASKGDAILTVGEDDKALTLRHDGAVYEGIAIDCKYPDWRKVLPQSTDGVAGAYNQRYIGDMGEAAQILSGKKSEFATISQNGAKAALVNIGTEPFVAALMPMRDTVKAVVPPWAMPKVEKSTKKPVKKSRAKGAAESARESRLVSLSQVVSSE